MIGNLSDNTSYLTPTLFNKKAYRKTLPSTGKEVKLYGSATNGLHSVRVLNLLLVYVVELLADVWVLFD